MKFLSAALLSILTLTSFSQEIDTLFSNSFENDYRKSNPTLKYSYDDNSQTHNYSDNWDFDNDGIKDEVYFIGTGGAHLYYFLKVVLSIDKRPRELHFIESDFPKLTAKDTVNFHKTPIGFVVTELGKNRNASIIVRLDTQTYYASKRLYRKRRIKSKDIVISFKNGKTKYGSL